MAERIKVLVTRNCMGPDGPLAAGNCYKLPAGIAKALMAMKKAEIPAPKAAEPKGDGKPNL